MRGHAAVVAWRGSRARVPVSNETGFLMRLLAVLACLALPVAAAAQEPAAAPKPAAITADGIPPVPAELAAATRPYFEFRTASFLDWNPADRSMLIATRFANTNQVHRVEHPGGARTQLTFEDEPVGNGSFSPGAGDTLLV